MFLEKIFWSAYVFYNIHKQKQVPFLSQEKIKEIQSARVKKIIKHAFETVPYYQMIMEKTGLAPSDFQSAVDIRKLPLITREDVQRDPSQFISTKYDLSKCLELKTSGSTGMPLSTFHHFSPLLLNMAIHQREREPITANMRRRGSYCIAALLTAQNTLNEIQAFCRRKVYIPKRVKDKYIITPVSNALEVNIDLINELKPDLIVGYGSYIETLFKHCLKEGKDFYKPKAIIYSVDMVSSLSRDLIEENFHIPLYSIYGAAEAPLIGFECEEHRGVHIHSDICALDIIDKNGLPVEPGASGEIVISNLTNKVMPLLNYMLGDVGYLQSERCRCGRKLPIIKIEGRKDDIFVLADGRLLSPILLMDVFYKREDISRYQIIQEDIDKFSVTLIPFKSEDFPKLKVDLLKSLRELLGESAEIKIRSVSSVSTGPRDKGRPVISKISTLS